MTDCGCPFYQGKPWHWDTCESSGAAEANRRDWQRFAQVVMCGGFESWEQIVEKIFYANAKKALANGGCRQ